METFWLKTLLRVWMKHHFIFAEHTYLLIQTHLWTRKISLRKFSNSPRFEPGLVLISHWADVGVMTLPLPSWQSCSRLLPVKRYNSVCVWVCVHTCVRVHTRVCACTHVYAHAGAQLTEEAPIDYASREQGAFCIETLCRGVLQRPFQFGIYELVVLCGFTLPKKMLQRLTNDFFFIFYS